MPLFTARRALRFLAMIVPALVFLAAAIPTPAGAIAIERVVSPGGIEAWLVRDQKVPVVAIEFAFRGGSALDPAPKAGLANLAAALLDEGAGALDAQAFQKVLEDNVITLGFGVNRDQFTGHIKTLTENQDVAFDLARLALTQPRFDDEALARVRNSILNQIRRDQGDPDWVASRTFADLVFAGHPYGLETNGTLETVPAITPEDLRAFTRTRLARDRLYVAVTGDITPERLGPALDRVFGELPESGAPYVLPETTAKGAGALVLVPRPTAQAIIRFGAEGVKRADPDWFPASLLNYVLGGGGFNSRLMEEVREKRGLSYGVYSTLQPMDHAALIMAGGSTVNGKAAEALALMKEVWRQVGERGITDKELSDAKVYMTGSFPLQFTSTSAIARIVLQVRLDDLGIDYLDRRNDLIAAVTPDDVKRVARRLLDPAKLATVVVGQPPGIEPTRVMPTSGLEGGRS